MDCSTGEGDDTHSSALAWKIPWTEEPGRLQSMGRSESDTTERLHFDFSLSCIGEGNGNPLQCLFDRTVGFLRIDQLSTGLSYRVCSLKTTDSISQYEKGVCVGVRVITHITCKHVSTCVHFCAGVSLGMWVQYTCRFFTD